MNNKIMIWFLMLILIMSSVVAVKYVFDDQDYSNEFNIINVSNLTAEQITATTGLSGPIDWSNLQNYPAYCPSGLFVTGVNDSLVCSPLSGSALIPPVFLGNVKLDNQSTNGLWNGLFYVDADPDPLNALLFAVTGTGSTGVKMPHFWIQNGGPSQSSGISRSFMIVNEQVSQQNTTNITSCPAYANSVGKHLKIDCNTSSTGADLLVGDDVQVFGEIFVDENVSAENFIGNLQGNSNSTTFWAGLTSFATDWFSDVANVLTFNENKLNETIQSSPINWTNLQNYPVACPAGSYVTQIDDTITCTVAVNDGDNIYIYRVGSTLNLNETKLNTSIDVKIDTYNQTITSYIDGEITTVDNRITAVNNSLTNNYYNKTDSDVRYINAVGDETITGNLSVTGTLDVGGIATTGDDVNISGDLEVGGDLKVGGGGTFNQDGQFEGNMIIDGNLTVLGDYVNATVEEQYLNGSFLPAIDNLFNIGSPTLGWDFIYAQTWNAIAGNELIIRSDTSNVQMRLRAKSAAGANEGTLNFQDGVYIQTGTLNNIAYFRDDLQTDFYGVVNMLGNNITELTKIESKNTALDIQSASGFSAEIDMRNSGGTLEGKLRAVDGFRFEGPTGSELMSLNEFDDEIRFDDDNTISKVVFEANDATDYVVFDNVNKIVNVTTDIQIVGTDIALSNCHPVQLFQGIDVVGNMTVTNVPQSINLTLTTLKDSYYNHSTTVNPAEVEILTSGLYKISAMLTVQSVSSAGGTRGNPVLNLEINNGTGWVAQPDAMGGYIRENAAESLSTSITGIGFFQFNANDKLRLSVHDTVTTEPDEETKPYSSRLLLEYVRP